MKSWYKKVGPFAWYRKEWFAVDLTFRSRILMLMTWKPGRCISVMVGGTVHKRSMYGRPSTVEPRWHFVSTATA